MAPAGPGELWTDCTVLAQYIQVVIFQHAALTAPGLQGDYDAHLPMFLSCSDEGHSEFRPFGNILSPSPNISPLNPAFKILFYPSPEEGENRALL